MFLSAINIFESRQVDVYGCIKAFFAIGEPLISNPVSWCTFSPNGREADELFYDFIYTDWWTLPPKSKLLRWIVNNRCSRRRPIRGHD